MSNYCIVCENRETKVKYLLRLSTNNFKRALNVVELHHDVLDVRSDDCDDEEYIYLFEHYSIEFENVKREYLRY